MDTDTVCNPFHFNDHRLLRLRVPVTVNQTAVIRWTYGNVELGTCQETLEGGNHFRYWIQNGPNANSGAIFMAVSYEMPIASTCLAILFRMLPLKSLNPHRPTQHHRKWVSVYVLTRISLLSRRGRYDLGRDWLVGNATAQSSIISTSNLTNASTYSGQTSFNGYTYHTSVNYVPGLLQNSSVGINHFESVAANGLNAIDGLVAVLTVKITSQPSPSRYACLDMQLDEKSVEGRRGHDVSFLFLSRCHGTATDSICG